VQVDDIGVTLNTHDTSDEQSRFEDFNARVEQRIQAVLASRRTANASGQAGEDIDNIREAMKGQQ
jgi:hypothetical protein